MLLPAPALASRNPPLGPRWTFCRSRLAVSGEVRFSHARELPHMIKSASFSRLAITNSDVQPPPSSKCPTMARRRAAHAVFMMAISSHEICNRPPHCFGGRIETGTKRAVAGLHCTLLARQQALRPLHSRCPRWGAALVRRFDFRVLLRIRVLNRRVRAATGRTRRTEAQVCAWGGAGGGQRGALA